MLKQTKLDTFLKKKVLAPVVPRLNVVPHRDIIIFLLQLGIPITERSLLRAMRQEVRILRAKGREVAPITLQKMQWQLKQLIREEWVEQIGHCYRLRR